MKARAEQMEKERKQQTIIGSIVVAVLAAIPLLGMGVCLGLLFKALRERG